MILWPTKQQWRRWSIPSKVGFIGSVASVLGLVTAGLTLLPGGQPALTSPTNTEAPRPAVRISQIGIDSQASQYVHWPKPTATSEVAGSAAGCDEITYLDCQCTYGWHGTDELLDNPQPGRVDAILSVTFQNGGNLPDLLTNLWVEVVDGGYKMGADNEVPIGMPVPAAKRYQVRLKEFGFLGDTLKPGTVPLVPPVTVPSGGVARIELQLMTQEDLATWYVVRFIFGFGSGASLDTGRLCGAVAL